MADSDYTIMANVNYVASTYEAPEIFAQVGIFVEKIIVGRDIETPNSILAFISGDSAEQMAYIDGLVGIGIFLACLVLTWFFTLLLLKFQGRERMGCAAGYAFHDSESDEASVVQARRERGGASGTLLQGDGQDVSVGAAVDPDDSVAMDEPELRKARKSSRSKSSGLSSLFGKKKKQEPPKARAMPESYIYDSRNLDEIELHMELDNIVQSATRDSERRARNGDRVWSLHSVPPKAVKIGDETVIVDDSSNDSKRSGGSNKTWVKSVPCLCSPEPEHVERRKFQTRLVFAFFAIVSLVCSALLVTHMYIPLESAALKSGETVQETAQIVDELNGALEILEEATAATVEMVESTPLSYQELCPNFAVESFRAQFGFDPQEMIQTISTQYRNYVPTIVDSLNTAKETGDSVTSMLVDINDTVSKTNEYLWIIPLIICITILIIFSQLALMLAVVYKEQKFKDIQTEVPKVENCYGWTILPLQTIVVLVSWLLVIVFCFGIILTTDSCIPSFTNSATGTSNGRGTPEDTVLAVLDQYMITRDSDQGTGTFEDLAQQRLSTYITGCDGMQSDPLAEVIVLQGLLQDSIEEVDTKISFANDVLGLEFIENECGPGNRVRTFFSNLIVLNGKFANVSMAIKQGYDALACPRVNNLYAEAVHGAFCTDFATANANGLVLLLLISFSGMILITLRASWRSAE